LFVPLGDDFQRAGKRRSSMRREVMMAKDPVCGMEIEKTQAKTSTVGGQTYYFCSDACKEKFDREPAKFTASAHAHH